jgi:type IV pilus assembly protein PilM
VERDDNAFAEDDVLAADLDGGTLDRLSAYGANPSRDESAPLEDVPAWSGEPAETPWLSHATDADGDVAVQSGDPVDEVAESRVADDVAPSQSVDAFASEDDPDVAGVVSTAPSWAVSETSSYVEAAEPIGAAPFAAADEGSDAVSDTSSYVEAAEPIAASPFAAADDAFEEPALDTTAPIVARDAPSYDPVESTLEDSVEPLAVGESDVADEERALDAVDAVGNGTSVTAADAEIEAVAEPAEPELAPDPLAPSDESATEDVADATPVGGRRRRLGRPRRDSSDSPKKRTRERKGKRLVGLKIGASQIAAAAVVNNGAPEVVGLWRDPLEPGLVVFGEIRDPDALGDALRAFFVEHKLPCKNVRLGIANNRVGVRVFELDGVTETRQLENAIRFRAEEVLPIPLDQAVLDYVILDESVLEDGTPRKRILLVVAYREVVDRYLQACAQAGIQVAGIDHEAFALLRSLAAPEARDASAGALVAVAIGHDRTTIAVSNGSVCEFTRVLDWGGSSLNVALAREIHRAPSEVEELKRQLSFAHETAVDGLDGEQLTRARNAMRRALEAFARELVASLQFYQGQPGALGIGEIVLTGGAAHMDGLPGALGEVVGVPVRLGDPLQRVKVGAHVEHVDERGSLAIAIGLGIED